MTGPRLFSPDLDLAFRLLREPIPRPRPPRPRPSASWRLLKPGQRLQSLMPLAAGIVWIPAGYEFEVLQTDSLGVLLSCPAAGTSVRWSDPDWKRVFQRSKVRKGVNRGRRSPAAATA